MAKWIDLNDRTTGARLKVARIEDNTYLFVVGLSEASPRWAQAQSKLGFASGGNGRFLIRKAMPGEKTSAKFFHPVWPHAALAEMEQKDFILDLNKNKPRAQATDEERKLSNETANAARLGRNADGDEVYEGPLGRFIWRDRFGATYESDTLRPAMLLRAPDDASLDLCCDGYVRGMVMGEVQHSEDFDRFVAAVAPAQPFGAGSPALLLRDKVHAAVEAAVVRHLTREFDTPQDAYGESVRLYELSPPFSGTPRGKAAMPSPLAVIAQRLLGDTAGATIVVPNAYDGAAFSFLSSGTQVRAFRGAKDLSGHAEGFIKARAGVDVVWENSFVPGRGEAADGLFFNADPAVKDGARSDYASALLALRSLKAGGRAVLVLAGDDPRRPGALSAESERFLRTLGARYEVELGIELNSALAQRVGTSSSLRVIALRNRAAGAAPSRADNAWSSIEKLEVAHSWDEVKAAVDEAIAQAKVREAEPEGVDVERSAQVNVHQSPYITFSKVSESRTMVPKNLQAPLQAALSDLEAVNGPVDAFVEREIGFGENTLGERFTAEQVDALGLGIARIKKGRGIVVADETGIGKGRTLGALCTFASKQGRPVVFITDRANLFSDLARDLRDIGEWGRFRPLITNADGNIVDTISKEDPAPMMALACPPSRLREILEANTPLDELPENIIFTTYSQISGESSDKATWIKNQLADALLVVDEAHIAAGSDSSIARQVSEMTNLAWGVVYSSATWAKSAENLHVYARALPESINIANLTTTMKAAGEGFSEIFSGMLARDGALIRREHDLSRLEFVLEVDTQRLARNRAVADQAAVIMGQIGVVSGDLEKMMVRLSRASIDALKSAKEARGAARAEAGRLAEAQGGTASLFRTAFGAGSMLYQVQRRMNAALNIDNIERLALRAIEEGRKPVIVFDDTGEAFVRRALSEAEVVDGRGRAVRPDVIRTPTLRDLMRKVVDDLGSVRVSEITYDEIMDAQERGVDLVADVAAALDDEGEGGAAGAPDAPQAPARAPDEQAPQAEEGAAAAPVGGGRRARAAAQTEEILIEEAAALQEGAGDGAATEAPKARKKSRSSRLVRIDQLPGLSDRHRKMFAEGVREIMAQIDALPALPLSIADELHTRLRAHGLSTGEISGRNFMLKEEGAGMSRVMPRPKSKAFVNATVKAFNRGDLDVAVINRSAATGLSLHASPRFQDRRRRELIEGQSPENPSERIQLFGRVNRLDQESFPRISIASTGIPGETKQIMMNNKKLAKMSANVRSSRETHAVISEVTDLLNPLGRAVCRQFFLDNPLYATRMMVDLDRIESKSLDAAGAFVRYISLLPVAQQEHLYEQVNLLFEEAVLKADLLGENPLKAKELDIRAKTAASTVLLGIDHGGLGSAFDGPVHAKAIEYEEMLRPMGWADVCAEAAASREELLRSGAATQVGTMLDEMRTPIISMRSVVDKTVEQIGALARTALAATTYLTTDEAMAAAGSNPVKRGMARKLWLERCLPRMVPGARLSLPHPNPFLASAGTKVPYIIASVTPPKEGRESQLAHWKFMLAKPGSEFATPYSLNSLLQGVALVETPGGLDTVNDVLVGGDVLLAPDSNQNVALVHAFDRAPAGKRYRSAAVLTGNMYLAAEFATEAKIGHGVVYTDEMGLRHRAIVLDKMIRPRDLRFMPVRVSGVAPVQTLLLELSGLSADRVIHREDGTVVAGAPALAEAEMRASGNLLYTTFAGAWRAQTTRTITQDVLAMVPGEGVLMSMSKEQAKRVHTMLSSAQRKIREEVALRAAEAAEAAEAAAAAATGGESPEATAATAAAAAAARPAAGRIRKRRATRASDPDAVIISGAKTARGAASGTIHLKATTAGQMRRAIDMIVRGVGLQIYADPNSKVGKLAKQVVRDDMVARLRAGIGDDPVRLAQLEEQLSLSDRAGDPDLEREDLSRLAGMVEEQISLDLVETSDGEVVAEQGAAENIRRLALIAEGRDPDAEDLEAEDEGGERPRLAA